jgi:hypothetical protein
MGTRSSSAVSGTLASTNRKTPARWALVTNSPYPASSAAADPPPPALHDVCIGNGGTDTAIDCDVTASTEARPGTVRSVVHTRRPRPQIRARHVARASPRSGSGRVHDL